MRVALPAVVASHRHAAPAVSRNRWLRCLAAALALLLAACSGSSSPRVGGGTPAAGPRVTVRLGYFANLTHATAIAGVEQGIFARDLGDSEDARLRARYPRRTAWLLEPDAQPPRLTRLVQ